jgi:hypothetical protein
MAKKVIWMSLMMMINQTQGKKVAKMAQKTPKNPDFVRKIELNNHKSSNIN